MWWGKEDLSVEKQSFDNPRPGEPKWKYDQRRQRRADAFNQGGEVLEKMYERYSAKCYENGEEE